MLKKILELYKKYREGINYLITGGIGTVVSIFSFALLLKIGIGTVAANVISWVIVVILMYILNRYFVFLDHATDKKGIIKEISLFALARVMTLIIETVVVYVGIDLLKFNSDFGSVAVKTFGQVLVIVLNFVFSKLFIFSDSKKSDDKTNNIGNKTSKRK